MSGESQQLLKLLGMGAGAARLAPASAAVRTGPLGSSGVAGGEFAALLNKARSGELVSNRPVTVESGAGISLSDDQLARLSIAADKAEAEGMRTALVLLDGDAAILDVQSRTITARADRSGGVTGGVDGVIDLTSGSSSANPATALTLPSGFSLNNPSLTQLLASLKPSDKRSEAA